MTQWHEYQCEKGCGHKTIIDKFYKGKRVFCGVCGTKSTMVYQGERLVTDAPKTKSQMNPFAAQAKTAAFLANGQNDRPNPFVLKTDKPQHNPFG